MWKKNAMKSFVCLCLAVASLLGASALCAPVAPTISAPGALLMEKETGQVIFEKMPDTARPPASVTKVMTLLLTMEALERGALRLDERVSISRTAQSMGGSQVYMAEGESYTVDELLKAVVIASGNDAAVALAEHLAGSEEAFVARMNDKAKEIGMTNTTFKNCTGLPADGHATSPRDIAIMSRALLQYPTIKNYTTIWMDTLRDGTFGLNNTNKLIRFYPGATGLKTGSTGLSKYCLSGTAERGGMELIAVIMGADSSDARFEDARALLDFGFANFTLAAAYPNEVLKPIPVILGKKSEVQPKLAENKHVLVDKNQLENLYPDPELPQDVHAPVEAGQKLGELRVFLGPNLLEVIPIVASESVDRLGLFDVMGKLLAQLMVS